MHKMRIPFWCPTRENIVFVTDETAAKQLTNFDPKSIWVEDNGELVLVCRALLKKQSPGMPALYFQEELHREIYDALCDVDAMECPTEELK